MVPACGEDHTRMNVKYRARTQTHALAGQLIYLGTQDGAPGVEHHHADDTAAHDHSHQEDHHHTQLRWKTQRYWVICVGKRQRNVLNLDPLSQAVLHEV